MKYIKLPRLSQREILAEIAEQLKARDTWSKLTWHVPTPPEDTPRPQVKFAPGVYERMMMYVDSTDTEIAWNGCVTRDKNNFLITKVFLYPQTVTGTTVQTDDTEGYGPYDAWVDSLDIETYNTMRFQGHSHVNMAVNPSQTDLDAEAKRTEHLTEGDFYLFLIINKRRNVRWALYDFKTSILYETDDIDYETVDMQLMKEVEEEKEEFVNVESPATRGSDTFFIPPGKEHIPGKYNCEIELGGWKTVPGFGFKQCHTFKHPEKVSKKCRKRLANQGLIFIEETPITTIRSHGIYCGGYGGYGASQAKTSPSVPAAQTSIADEGDTDYDAVTTAILDGTTAADDYDDYAFYKKKDS